MKKIATRVIAMAICIVVCISAFAGCSTVSKTDRYLTKGEFMRLFVDEIGVSLESEAQALTSGSVEDRYHYAESVLVQLGCLSEQETGIDLDKAVTKEFVATVCTERLYFRNTYDIQLKDEEKLKNPQACKDAVGHEIVAMNNGYFDANEKMTYEACKSAIDRMLYIDATSSFEEDEAELEYTLKEGVIDISSEADEMGFRYIDPDSEEGKDILVQMGFSVAGLSFSEENHGDNSAAYGVHLLTGGSVVTTEENTTCPMPVPVDQAKEGDTILVSCLTNGPRLFEEGDIFVYSPWLMNDMSPNSGNQPIYSVGGIVRKATQMPFNIYYLVEVVSPEQLAELLKIDKVHNESINEKWKLEEYGGNKGVSAKIEDSAIVVEVHDTLRLDNGQTWHDPQYKIQADYTFEIKDMALEVSGFGDIFDGNIDDAIFKLSYRIENDLKLTSENRITPDNNGNGKFPSNLRRSRLTSQDSKGAATIKIAKLHVPIYAGIEVQIDINLEITVDGQIHITLSKAYENGFRITNNILTPIHQVTDETKEYSIFANTELGINFIFTAKFFCCPIADLTVTPGLGASFRASLSATGTTEQEDDRSIENAYISREALEAMTEQVEYDYEYEVGVQIYVFIKIHALSEKCTLGKIMKSANIALKPSKAEWVVYEKTYTNKENTDSENEEPRVSDDINFTLTVYKLVFPEYTCSITRIVEYPVNADDLEAMGGIRVYTTDPSVAVARLDGNTICIESMGVGSTELIIETANKRFIQKCSITVVENSTLHSI